MLISLALLLLVGIFISKVVESLRLPSLLGMLFAGMLLGPYGLNLLSPQLHQVSQDLRTLALIVILLRAGLGIKRTDLAQIGSAAIRLSSMPCIVEGLAVMGMARWLLNFTWPEAGMLGFILAAVSPAVVVPALLGLKEQGYGEDKQISTMILAGASADDVFAITLFSLFLGLGLQAQTHIWLELMKIPVSIGLGILGGVIVAFLLLRLYDAKTVLATRNTEKLLVLLAASILYFGLGEYLGIASLLGVMAIGLVILERRERSAVQFSAKLSRFWVFAQIILFTLVGAEVNTQVALEAGLLGVAIIAVGLVGRSIGVWLATLGTNLNRKEKLFCMIAYTPKATVQAAIGAIPLAMGIPAGPEILAIAVMAILITAPLGAVGIRLAAPALLHKLHPEEG